MGAERAGRLPPDPEAAAPGRDALMHPRAFSSMSLLPVPLHLGLTALDPNLEARCFEVYSGQHCTLTAAMVYCIPAYLLIPSSAQPTLEYLELISGLGYRLSPLAALGM